MVAVVTHSLRAEVSAFHIAVDAEVDQTGRLGYEATAAAQLQAGRATNPVVSRPQRKGQKRKPAIKNAEQPAASAQNRQRIAGSNEAVLDLWGSEDAQPPGPVGRLDVLAMNIVYASTDTSSALCTGVLSMGKHLWAIAAHNAFRS